MLTDIFHVLKTNMEGLGLCGKVYPIVEIKRTIEDGRVRTFPSTPTGTGQGQQIELDVTNGMSYFRKDGAVSINQVQDQKFQLTSCAPGNDTIYSFRFFIKQVCFIPKRKADDCINGFEDDILAQRIIANLTDKGIIIANAKSASLLASGYETDRIKVLNSEYSNADDINDLNYEYSYFSIQWDLEVVMLNSCIDVCSDSYAMLQ